MCILLLPAERVQDTKIFVSTLDDRARQLTVFSASMRFLGGGRSVKNIMIIPVPTDPLQQDGGIRIHDFSSYKHIFNDLESFFPEEDIGGFNTKTRHINMLTKKMREQPFGAFEASVAEDFSTLRNVLETLPSTFNIQNKDRLLSFIARRYTGGNFGFIVCKIFKSARFYPIAFSAPMVLPNQYFIPTVAFDAENGVPLKTCWDHTIYATNRKRMPIFQAPLAGVDSVDSKLNAKDFDLKMRKMANRMPHDIEPDNAITLWRTKINSIFKKNIDVSYLLFRPESNGFIKHI